MQPIGGARPVVLIVEDEILLRLHVSEIIEDGGFDVIEAENADDAISVLEQRNDVVLIFTDVNMPGSMDGLKLAHFVKDRWPPIKIIATSGHARIRANDLPEGSHFMPKPYNATELTDVIHQLIQP
jgi:two-component system, response regulator PdtaR